MEKKLGYNIISVNWCQVVWCQMVLNGVVSSQCHDTGKFTYGSVQSVTENQLLTNYN